MKFVLACVFVVAVLAAPELELPAHFHALEVNSLNAGWEAGFNPRFEGKTLGDVKALCGTNLVEEEKMRAPFHHVEVPVDVPSDFDSRTGFPQCANVIGHVRDQSTCGSCWAFGSTEAFNDRLCISTNGTFQTLLSTQDTTSCCNFLKCFSQGCGGGQPSAAWKYFVNYGVVTGGDYESDQSSTCWNYELPSCSHHVDDPKIANCSSSDSPTPACATSCGNKGYSNPFAADKKKAKTSYSVSGVDQLMAEIYKNGPVTGAFTVYADFPTYKSGVYKHVTGSALGGHAIKIFGWGVENGTPYWLVMNSWNADWGHGGTFKILRGADECGIESQISCGSV